MRIRKPKNGEYSLTEAVAAMLNEKMPDRYLIQHGVSTGMKAIATMFIALQYSYPIYYHIQN